jgi:ribosome-associated toxin RatA of RatAB toxin-antitoxin module
VTLSLQFKLAHEFFGGPIKGMVEAVAQELESAFIKRAKSVYG